MPIINMVYKKKKGWKPGANTIAYYPLKADFNDASGNSRNLTNTNVSTTTLSGVKCAYFNGSSSYLTYNGYSLGNTARTINVWCYINRPNSSSNNQGVIHICNPTSNSNLGGSFGLQFTNSTTVRTSDWNSASAESLTATVSSGWNNIVATQEGTTVKLYVNGNYIGIISNYPGQQASPNGWRLGASCRSEPGNYFKGYMSNAIIENKVRTAQEISDYYNQTKGNYQSSSGGGGSGGSIPAEPL